MFRRIVTCCLIGVLIAIALPASAQRTDQQDFTNVRVDEMSDAQVRAFMKQVEVAKKTDGMDT